MLIDAQLWMNYIMIRKPDLDSETADCMCKHMLMALCIVVLKQNSNYLNGFLKNCILVVILVLVWLYQSSLNANSDELG